MQYGGKILFKDSSFQLLPRNHYGLVGPNGSGKSTLIRIITGELTPDQGNIAIPSLQTIGTLKQDHFIYDQIPICDVVIMGKQCLWQAIEKKELLLQKHSFSEEDCHQLAALEKVIEEFQGYAAHSAAAQILDGLGIPNHVHDKPMHILSGGHKLRVLLAQLLFSAPDVLLLDEPTNHLDIFSIRWLEGYLRDFPGTILLSSHDRHFLNAVCSHIIDIDYGIITTYVGNYDTFEQKKLDVSVLKESQFNKQEKRKDDMMDFVKRFGAKATKAGQAQSRMKMVEKLEISMEALEQQPSSRRYPKFSFDLCRQPGATVLKIDNIAKSFGQKCVLSNVSLEIERGERVAFVGANGIGKSTLLEILMNHLQADKGAFTWGFETHCAYFPQDHAREVHGKQTLLDWLGQYDTKATRETLQKVLARALFSGDDVSKPTSILSGGETARLIVAKMMLVKQNILIFDEPTNHLDMEAIEALLKALESYAGTILFVSHNRYFVEKLATRVIEMTQEGIHDFKCTYGEYVQKRELDHLDINKAMKLSCSTTPKNSQEAPKQSHQDQKKIQRQRDQLQRKVEAAEKACHTLECSLKELNDQLCQPNFYSHTPKEEQAALLEKKERIENELATVLLDWEHASELFLNG